MTFDTLIQTFRPDFGSIRKTCGDLNVSHNLKCQSVLDEDGDRSLEGRGPGLAHPRAEQDFEHWLLDG